MLLTEVQSRRFFHGGGSDLHEGKIYVAKRSRGTFGDYEKIIEHYRPADKPSRLSSFYLTLDRYMAEQHGYLYAVEPVGKYAACAFGWMSILKHTVAANDYKKNYGYKIDFRKVKKTDQLAQICTNYWNGKRLTTADYRQYDEEPNMESEMIEVLAPRIRIIKAYNHHD